MAEPTAQRLRVTFTVKRADNDRFILACDPLASESAPVIPGSDPTEGDAALAASDPTETEAVTEAQARHLAQQMTDLLSHLMYTPR
jgi:hypothetical protein